MVPKTLADRKAVVRSELERRARAGQTVTYGEIAPMAGVVPQGMAKILDIIKAEETGRRRPDLGCLVVNSQTGFPGNVGKHRAERDRALVIREAVFSAWREAGEPPA